MPATIPEINTQINVSFPDNTTGEISAADLRNLMLLLTEQISFLGLRGTRAYANRPDAVNNLLNAPTATLMAFSVESGSLVVRGRYSSSLDRLYSPPNDPWGVYYEINLPEVLDSIRDTGLFSLNNVSNTPDNLIAQIVSSAPMVNGLVQNMTVVVIPPVNFLGQVSLTLKWDGGENTSPLKATLGGTLSGDVTLRASRPYIFRRHGNEWRMVTGDVVAGDLKLLRDDITSVMSNGLGVIPLATVTGTGDAFVSDIRESLKPMGFTNIAQNGVVEMIPTQTNTTEGTTLTVGNLGPYPMKSQAGAAIPANYLRPGQPYLFQLKSSTWRLWSGDVSFSQLRPIVRTGSVITLENVTGEGNTISGTLPEMLDSIGQSSPWTQMRIEFVSPVTTNGPVTLKVGANTALLKQDRGTDYNDRITLTTGRTYSVRRHGNEWRMVAGDIQQRDLQDAMVAESFARQQAINTENTSRQRDIATLSENITVKTGLWHADLDTLTGDVTALRQEFAAVAAASVTGIKGPYTNESSALAATVEGDTFLMISGERVTLNEKRLGVVKYLSEWTRVRDFATLLEFKTLNTSGAFQYFTNGTTVHVNGATYVRDSASTALSGLPGWEPGPVVTPAMTGAVGDWIADDTAALQAIVNYACNRPNPAGVRGRPITIDLAGRAYQVSNPIVISAPVNTMPWVKLTNGTIRASESFPVGVPIIVLGDNTNNSMIERLVIDCNFRAAGILSFGGNGSAQNRIRLNSISRYKRFGIGMGVEEHKVSSGHTIKLWDAIVGQTSGATAIVVNRMATKIKVGGERASQNPPFEQLIPGENLLVDGVVVGVMGERGGRGSAQCHIHMNAIFGLHGGDPGYDDMSFPLDPGILVNSNDAKASENIVSRCTPSIYSMGSLNSFTTNHTHPTPRVASTLWTVNYEIRGGGTQITDNYIDNGSIDLYLPGAANTNVNANTFMKITADNAANDAGVRLIPTQVNVDVTANLNIADNILAGSASGFPGLIKYDERFGTMAAKLSAKALSEGKSLSAHNPPLMVVNIRPNAQNAQSFATARGICRTPYYDNTNAEETPASGSSGGNFTIWQGDRTVLQYDPAGDGFNMQGGSMSAWRYAQQTLTSNTTLTSGHLGKLLVVAAPGVTITLPPSAGLVAGAQLIVGCTTSSCKIAPAAGDMIDGATGTVDLVPNRAFGVILLGTGSWARI